jgi:tetratricopeptide (TPR) repeat protein
MIVRNEEKMLPACLQSIDGLADEVVAVDTGSTDRTIVLLQDFGARVYQHPWEDDFSAHRNQCLGYAAGDWILQVDADERLQGESVAEVRRLIKESPAEITHYLVEIHDCDRRGRRKNYFLFPRLFRNHAGATYKGQVHNQLFIEGGRGRSRIRFDHLGYHLDAPALQRKFERTRALLLKQIERDPDDLFALLNLALAHAMHQDADGVIEYGERLASRLQAQDSIKPIFFSLYHPLAAAQLSRSDFSRAEALAKSALRREPGFPDGHHLLAWIALLQKDYAGVLAHGDAFELSLKAWESRPAELDEIESHALSRACEAQCWRGAARLAAGEISSALAHFETGFKDPSFDEHMALHLLRLLGELKPEMLMDWGPRCLQLFSDDIDYVFAALSVLQQAAGVSVMRYCLGVLDTKHLPADGDLYQRALLHLLREEYLRATELLACIESENPHYADAQRQLRYCGERLRSSERLFEPVHAGREDTPTVVDAEHILSEKIEIPE